MACYSGNLVDQFERKKSKWADWSQNGRSLFVMSSSDSDETSSTGPGTDKDEAAGRQGTAGSAFGHALWKALLGYADGTLDGIKDGYLSLGEIREYTRKLTKKIGGHNIRVAGSYHEALIMNRAPSAKYQAAVDTEANQKDFIAQLSEPMCGS